MFCVDQPEPVLRPEVLACRRGARPSGEGGSRGVGDRAALGGRLQDPALRDRFGRVDPAAVLLRSGETISQPRPSGRAAPAGLARSKAQEDAGAAACEKAAAPWRIFMPLLRPSHCLCCGACPCARRPCSGPASSAALPACGRCGRQRRHCRFDVRGADVAAVLQAGPSCAPFMLQDRPW